MSRTRRVLLALTGPTLATTVALSACTGAPPAAAPTTSSVAPDRPGTADAPPDCGRVTPSGNPVADRLRTARAVLLAAAPDPAVAPPAVTALVAGLAADLDRLAERADTARPEDLLAVVQDADERFRRAAADERALPVPVAWRTPGCAGARGPAAVGG